MNVLRLSTLLACCFLVSQGAKAQNMTLKPGTVMPDMTLALANEPKSIGTESFFGKKTVVHIFASW